MGYRVYLTHSEKHEDGFLQVKAEDNTLHRAVGKASNVYIAQGTREADRDKLAKMLEQAWDRIAGDVRRKCETVVSIDQRLVVEIYRS